MKELITDKYRNIFGTEPLHIIENVIAINHDSAADICLFPPARGRDYFVYATAGLSSFPLEMCDYDSDIDYLEILFKSAATSDEVMLLARTVGEYFAVVRDLTVNHIIVNIEIPGTYSSIKGMLFSRPRDHSHYITLDDRDVYFIEGLGITGEEMEWAVELNKSHGSFMAGSKILAELLHHVGDCHCIDPLRKSIFEETRIIRLADDVVTAVENINEAQSGLRIEEKEDKDKAYLYGRVESDGRNMDVIRIVRNIFVNNYACNPGEDDETTLFNRAGEVYFAGKYDEAIELYRDLLVRFPHNSAKYNTCIGASWFFLGEYEKAISFYKLALACGESRSDYNIWEASCILFRKQGENRYIEEYLSLFPDGKYRSEAMKMLNMQ